MQKPFNQRVQAILLMLASMLSVILLGMAQMNYASANYAGYFDRLNEPLAVEEAAYGTHVQAEVPFFKRHKEYANELVARAFIKGAIYYAEGTYPNDKGLTPYKIIVSFKTIDDFGLDYSDHPRQLIWIPNIQDSSDAAGACQFISTTWDGLHRLYPDVWYADIPAFAPKNQDLACLINFVRTGGYKILMNGVSVTDAGRITVDVEAFTDAVAAACGQWASFPDRSGYACIGDGKQYAKPIEDIWKNFQQALDELQAGFVPGADLSKDIAPAENNSSGNPSDLLPERLRGPLKDGEVVEACFYDEGGSKQPCFVTDIIRIRDKHPTLGVRTWHRGNDIGMTVGTPLYAFIDGWFSCHADEPIWGNYGIFESDSITGIYWLLHHLSECNAEIGGSKIAVKKGQLIAKSGTAGTGPHLHLEGWRLVGGEWEFFDYPKGWATAFSLGDIPRS